MLTIVAAIIAMQAAQAPATRPNPENDVYMACFFRELSAIEGRDSRNAPGPVSKKNGALALERCQSAKEELRAQTEKALAADPAYADPAVRATAVKKRVALTQVSLEFLVFEFGE